MKRLFAFWKAATGIDSPLKSWTFWAMVLILGLPAAVSKFFGIDLDANHITAILDPKLDGSQRLVAIMALLGLRRRLK